MAKKKYYAVKKGRTEGILESWDDCKSSVDGFPGAIYKSFSSLEEAEEFLNEADAGFLFSGENISGEIIDVGSGICTEISQPASKIINSEKYPAKKPPKNKLKMYLETAGDFDFEALGEDAMAAYVDGSYDVKTGRYSFGCVLLTKKYGSETESGVGERPEARTARNVAGELMGTMFAAKTALSRGYKKLIVYHDYIGISQWYLKKWKAQSFCAVEYISYMDKLRPYLDISFSKVESHTGVPLNEAADLLAKAALGI